MPTATRSLSYQLAAQRNHTQDRSLGDHAIIVLYVFGRKTAPLYSSRIDSTEYLPGSQYRLGAT